jgi:ABC-type branched-subunit amino acid transport system permease subunit
MACLIARVATAGTADAKGWAISLYVAYTLAMVTLFCFRCSRMRAGIALVALGESVQERRFHAGNLEVAYRVACLSRS